MFILLAGSVVWIGNGWKMGSPDGPQKGSDSSIIFPEFNNSNENEAKKRTDEETSSSDIPVKDPEDAILREVEAPSIAEQPAEAPEEDSQEVALPTDPAEYIQDQPLPKEPKFVHGVLLANKQYPLPADYAPGESEEAREAFNELAASAATSGINLQAFSTYRSFDYQVTLYNRYVERDGQEAADRYSARPGYSEHQTGLAFDIGEANHEKNWASNSFGDTEDAKWLAPNAHQFRFIIRYPEGKEDVTGYMHESWHYRYVGKDVAEKVFKRNITLEEYLGIR